MFVVPIEESGSCVQQVGSELLHRQSAVQMDYLLLNRLYQSAEISVRFKFQKAS